MNDVMPESKTVHQCCETPMRAASFGRGFVCLTCGQTVSLFPRNAAVQRELAAAAELVRQGRQDELVVDVKITEAAEA